MTAALDQQCGLAARFDRMEVGERRVAARERHEVTLGETRLVEDRRGRFMVRDARRRRRPQDRGAVQGWR